MPAGGALLAAVRVLVTVLDPATGMAVNGLGPADFTAAPVRVESVTVALQPVEMLLLLDNSAAGDGLRRTAQDLIDKLRPPDRMALAVFNSSMTLVHPFSADRDALARALGGVQFGGDPRLLDSLSAAVEMPFPGHGYRKVIVLLTAGIEGPSRAMENAVVQAAVQKGIAIYPVYEHGSGRWTFPGIAKQTGGAAFWLREIRELSAIVETIRSPYLITLSGAGPVKLKGREKTFVSSLPFASE